MRLKYQVLWFDDTEDFFDSLDMDYLKSQISAWGFVPEIELVTTPQTFLEKAPFADFDLLVIDYNLEAYGHGEEFIAKVRDQEVLTEIIFYSSAPAQLLWDAVYKRKLEGIYVANRDTVSERILKVGRQTLRKVLDLENMRGIVMAEVGDLDLLLDEILKSAIPSLSSSAQANIFKGFHDASSEHHAELCKKLDEFKESPSIDLLLTLCDSNKRWQNFGRAKRHHKVLKGASLGDYVVEILRPRNFLAHGMPRKQGNESYIFAYQGKEYLFNESVGTALRLAIIKYKQELQKIKAVLAGGT